MHRYIYIYIYVYVYRHVTCTHTYLHACFPSHMMPLSASWARGEQTCRCFRIYMARSFPLCILQPKKQTPEACNIGALILTYIILADPCYNYIKKYNGPQNPILIVKAPILQWPRSVFSKQEAFWELHRKLGECRWDFHRSRTPNREP